MSYWKQVTSAVDNFFHDNSGEISQLMIDDSSLDNFEDIYSEFDYGFDDAGALEVSAKSNNWDHVDKGYFENVNSDEILTMQAGRAYEMDCIEEARDRFNTMKDLFDEMSDELTDLKEEIEESIQEKREAHDEIAEQKEDGEDVDQEEIESLTKKIAYQEKIHEFFDDENNCNFLVSEAAMEDIDIINLNRSQLLSPKYCAAPGIIEAQESVDIINNWLKARTNVINYKPGTPGAQSVGQFSVPPEFTNMEAAEKELINHLHYLEYKSIDIVLKENVELTSKIESEEQVRASLSDEDYLIRGSLINDRSSLIAGLLINQEEAPKTNAKSGNTIIHDAAMHGAFQSLMFLHKALGMVIDEPNLNGDTPLMVAVKNRNIYCAQYLIQSGADIHKTNNQGKSVLIEAIEAMDAKEQYGEIFNCLFNDKTDRKIANEKGETAIELLLNISAFECVRALAGNGFSIESHNGESLAERAFESDRSSRIIKTLISAGAKLERPGDNHYIDKSIKHSFSLGVIEALISAGAGINAKHVLDAAKINVRKGVIPMLIDHGVDLSYKDDDGNDLVALLKTDDYRIDEATLKIVENAYLKQIGSAAKTRPSKHKEGSLGL